MSPAARAQRLARGWLVGFVATTVAAVSHSLAGGYRPGILSFGAALVFAGLLGTAVIGRRPSLPRLAIAVGGSQLAFHLLFSLLGAGSSSVTVTGMPGMAGMDAPGSAAVTSAVTPGLVAPGHDHLADPAMWIAHTIAAALTLLFLRHAELAVWTMLKRLVVLVVERIAVATTPVLPGEPARLPAELPTVRSLSSRLLVTVASRRGPPLLSF